MEQAVLQAMGLLPDQRFQSAAEFKRALVAGMELPQLLRVTHAPLTYPAATAPVAWPGVAQPTAVIPPAATTPVAVAPARGAPWGWVVAIGAVIILGLLLLVILLGSKGDEGDIALQISLARTGTALAQAMTAAVETAGGVTKQAPATTQVPTTTRETLPTTEIPKPGSQP
jgi:hypothetical protein